MGLVPVGLMNKADISITRSLMLLVNGSSVLLRGNQECIRGKMCIYVIILKSINR